MNNKVWKVGEMKGVSFGDCPAEFRNEKHAKQRRHYVAFCTEKKNHEGQHVAVDVRGRVVEVWD